MDPELIRSDVEYALKQVDFGLTRNNPYILRDCLLRIKDALERVEFHCNATTYGRRE